MIFKIPNRITVLGRAYKVSLKNDKFLKRETGMHVDGSINYGAKNIYIKEDMLQTSKEYTLIHETVHLIMNTTGLDQVILPELQEIICESITSGMHDFMRQVRK